MLTIVRQRKQKGDKKSKGVTRTQDQLIKYGNENKCLVLTPFPAQIPIGS